MKHCGKEFLNDKPQDHELLNNSSKLIKGSESRGYLFALNGFEYISFRF